MCVTNLFNPTSGRDASHPCLISTWPKEGCTMTHTMVHLSLGQVLIRQGCEASLPNVGLNKFVRVALTPQSIPKADNSLLIR